jgi:hypothetical protein
VTTLELIRGALRLIGGLGVGRGIVGSGSIATDCLFTLNTMIQSWNTQRLLIYSMEEQSVFFTAGGNSASPGLTNVRLESAQWAGDGSESPLDIVDYKKYFDRQNDSVLTLGRPSIIAYNAGFESFHVHPTPEHDGTAQLIIWARLQSLTINQTIVLPDGYERALMYNLAVDLAPQFPDTTLSQVVIDTARESKADIKRMNLPSPELSVDPALVGRTYDVKLW